MERSFDLVFENPLKKDYLPLKTIGEILFDKNDARDEKSKIILSHFNNKYVEISLSHLRQIVHSLIEIGRASCRERV